MPAGASGTPGEGTGRANDGIPPGDGPPGMPPNGDIGGPPLIPGTIIPSSGNTWPGGGVSSGDGPLDIGWAGCADCGEAGEGAAGSSAPSAAAASSRASFVLRSSYGSLAGTRTSASAGHCAAVARSLQ